MVKQWIVSAAGRDYKIELEHNIWTNTQKVSINGQVIFETPGKLQIGGVTCFNLEGQVCAVIVTNKVLGFSYDLVIDGVSVVTKKKVKYIATQPLATVTNGIIHKS